MALSFNGYTASAVSIYPKDESLEEFYIWVMEHNVTLEGMMVCAKENFSNVEKYFRGRVVRWGVDTTIEYKNSHETVVFKFDNEGKPIIGKCVYDQRTSGDYERIDKAYTDSVYKPLQAPGPYGLIPLQPMQPWEMNDNTVIGGKSAASPLDEFKKYSYCKSTDLLKK